MFSLCIESSHKRGMGHFYRALNLIEYLEQRQEPYVLLVNDDERAVSLLKEKHIHFLTVNLSDFTSDWETRVINEYGIDVWVNDRMQTQILHAEKIKRNNIKLITFDDQGSGAQLADINFCPLAGDTNTALPGKRIITGIDYLILNSDIGKYKKQRTQGDKILVSLGGSDTYSVTMRVIKILKKLGRKATIVIGPSFKNKEKLIREAGEEYHIKSSVPSLIQEFYEYDFAITGGGITPFEANASGLPCIIIANELHEIANGRFLQKMGSSIFAGHYENIDKNLFKKKLNIETMSKIGLSAIPLNGVENIYREIRAV